MNGEYRSLGLSSLLLYALYWINMLIPYQNLEPETLTNLIESFILREGTDYGEHEFSLSQKSKKVLQQIKEGSVVILFSQLSQSVTLIHKNQLAQQMQCENEQ